MKVRESGMPDEHIWSKFFDVFAGADRPQLDKIIDRYTDTADKTAHRVGRSNPSHSDRQIHFVFLISGHRLNNSLARDANRTY